MFGQGFAILCNVLQYMYFCKKKIRKKAFFLNIKIIKRIKIPNKKETLLSYDVEIPKKIRD